MEFQYFNRQAECAGRDELAAGQFSDLRKTLARTLQNPWFRSHLKDSCGLEHPEDFRSLDDLARLPFMTKKDFRKGYPLGLCCVPQTEIAEMHMSSGSTGSSIAMPYTCGDLAVWGELMARLFVMGGAQKGDPCQITSEFGLFNGSFGCYQGAQAAGLFVIPTGPGKARRQIKLANDFQTRLLVAVVSFASQIADIAEKEHLSMPSLKAGFFGAEPFSDSMKQRLRSILNIDVFDMYGLTETGGGGICMDCPVHAGLHLWEDHFLCEIVDPVTGEVLPDGEYGELTLTTLRREALPVIRFRTGDRTRILSRDVCACGRTHLRIEPVQGRYDDMLVVSGVNFFPSQVEHLLLRFPELSPNFQLILDGSCGVNRLKIRAEALAPLSALTVKRVLRENLGFMPDLELVTPGTLPPRRCKVSRTFVCTPENPDGHL